MVTCASPTLAMVHEGMEISDRIKDGWTLKKHEDHVYLVKTVTQILKNYNTDDSVSLINSEDLPIDIQSDGVPSITIRKWEYHILYNFSYNVPVLYFNVWNSSGELLSLEELWKAINPTYKEHIVNNKWFALTQHEHPYLFQPFFYFHPCHSSDFVNLFVGKGNNALITWLSTIRQIIWLEMDHTYGKLCNFSDLNATKTM